MLRRPVVWLLLCSSLIWIPGASARERMTEHTLRLPAGGASPAATLAQMNWLEGRWTGKALGGEVEEIWSAPQAGAMLGIYRLVRDGKPVFYEFMTLVEENGSLVMRLKHFNPDLTGWEEKDRSVEFRLVALDDDGVHFEGLSMHIEGDLLTMHLAIEHKDSTLEEATFHYERSDAAAR